MWPTCGKAGPYLSEHRTPNGQPEHMLSTSLSVTHRAQWRVIVMCFQSTHVGHIHDKYRAFQLHKEGAGWSAGEMAFEELFNILTT